MKDSTDLIATRRKSRVVDDEDNNTNLNIVFSVLLPLARTQLLKKRRLELFFVAKRYQTQKLIIMQSDQARACSQRNVLHLLHSQILKICINRFFPKIPLVFPMLLVLDEALNKTCDNVEDSVIVPSFFNLP